MGQRVFDPLKSAMWLALVLALALMVTARHSPTMLPTAPSHSADHSGHDQPMPDHASCVLACMAFVEVVPAPVALPLRALIGLAVIPPVELLIGQETEWAGRPPWLSGF